MRILDHLYSNAWMMTTFFIVFMFLCVGLAFLSPFKNKIYNGVYKVMMYVIGGGVLFCLMFFNYHGFAHNFTRLGLGRTSLFLFEVYEVGGGEGPSETIWRLHIVDKKSGERKGRYYLGGSAEYFGVSGDSVCYRENKDIIVFNGNTLEEVYRIKEEDLSQLHNDLSVGIDHITSNQTETNAVKPIIQIACKNGKNYWLDPFLKTVYEKEPESVYLNEFSRKAYDLTVQISRAETRYFLRTQSVSGNRSYKIEVASDNHFFNKKETDDVYIDPFLMYLDTIKKVFVFGHYTTTDREDFFIEAQDNNFKTKWKKGSSDLNDGDSYNKAEVTAWKSEKGILYFNNGGFLIAIDPFTSDIIWTCRL